jgi:hypothetical protein
MFCHKHKDLYSNILLIYLKVLSIAINFKEKGALFTVQSLLIITQRTTTWYIKFHKFILYFLYNIFDINKSYSIEII